MTNAESVALKLEQIPVVNLLVGTFVARASDGMVTVDFGEGGVTVLSAGVTEPLPGESVRVLRTTDATIMLGSAVPRSSIGQVTATGTPRITVLTSVGSKSLPYSTLYTPVVSDNVLIDWDSGGIVLCKVTAVPAGSYTPPAPPPPTTFQADFRATDSGSYQESSGTWNKLDVYASDNNRGAWFYGTAIADSIDDAAEITRIQIYIPESYNGFPGSLANVGLHGLTGKSGAPTVSSLVNVSAGSGWKDLPVTFGDALKTYASKGIGTLYGGYHIWTSRAADADSGLLRIDWKI